MSKVKIGLAQIITRLGDIEGNRKRIFEAINKGKAQNVNIIVFPELATLGFGSGDIYLDRIDENLKVVDDIIKFSKDIPQWIILGYVERDKHGFFHNSAAVIGNGKLVGKYRKVQLVNYRLFDEKRYFSPGTQVSPVDTPFGKIGILICEDVWFPEPARILTMKGAEIIFVLSASPYDRGKPEKWEAFLKSRALDNIIPFVMVNQAGIQDGVTYWGGSFSIDASGKIIKRAKLLQPEMLVLEIDTDLSKILRRRDIRVREIRLEILEELLKAYREMSID